MWSLTGPADSTLPGAPSAYFAMNLAAIVHAVLEEYTLPLTGYHGVAHWARVLENGEKLALETGADADVVRLFSVLHDSRRVSEANDPLHGPRAAEFAHRLRGKVFEVTNEQFRLLTDACAGHTHERSHPEITVQTCWDADRLDLGRVGIMPDPAYLCTPVAKRSELLRWADGRAAFGIVPEFVRHKWGIALESD